MGLAGGIALTEAQLHTNNLDLYVNLDKTFAEGVDLDETGVHCAVESTKFRDQADVTLRHRLVRVGAEDTARDRAHGSNARA